MFCIAIGRAKNNRSHTQMQLSTSFVQQEKQCLSQKSIFYLQWILEVSSEQLTSGRNGTNDKLCDCRIVRYSTNHTVK